MQRVKRVKAITGMNETGCTRRFLLRAGLLMPAAAAFVVLRPAQAHAQPAPLAPTPACGEGEATPSQTAGPFFKPDSPERTSLIEPGITGDKLVLEGRVLSTQCRPVAGALVDLWQADADGRYDNAGYRLRGHQFTDAGGRYRFETIVPGNYFPRTRHCHLKVQAPGRPVLTTQLYFPGEGRNSLDFLFRRDLLMEITDGPDGKGGRFDFVLDLGWPPRGLLAVPWQTSSLPLETPKSDHIVYCTGAAARASAARVNAPTPR